MIPRWFEKIALLFLLLIAVWLRTWKLAEVPPGFSDPELHNIDIVDQIGESQIRVFYADPQGSSGQESFYQTTNMLLTVFVGDGLLGYRLLGLWANLLALCLLYRVAKALFGPGRALVSVAIMASNMSGILMARSVTPLALMPLLVMAVFAAMIWAYYLYYPVNRYFPLTLRYSVLGFLIGAAVYNHFTGVFLLLVLVFFISYLSLTEQPVHRLVWSSTLFSLTLVIILMLPYLISILREPTRSGVSILWTERSETPGQLADSFVATMGAFFIQGDNNPIFNMPGLPALFPIWSLLVLVGLGWSVRRWRQPSHALLLIMLVVGLLPDIWLRGGPDFEALVLVKPVLYVLAGMGAYIAAQVVRENNVPGGWKFVAALVVLTFFWSTWQDYQQILNEWGEREDVQQLYHTRTATLANYLDTQNPTDNLPTVICTDALRERRLPDGHISYSEPEMLHRMLHQEDHDLHFADCRYAMIFIAGGDPEQLIWSNPANLAEVRPQIQSWLANTTQREENGLSIFTMEAEEELAETGGQLISTSNLHYPLVEGEAERVELPVRFGGNVTLLGYQVDLQEAYAPGDIIAFTTFWRIDGTPPPNLGIFLRLHDTPQSSPYSENNGLDVSIAELRERDVIMQTSYLTVPLTLLPGEYVITLGIYDNNPLNQIAVFGKEATEPRGNYLLLAEHIIVEIVNAED